MKKIFFSIAFFFAFSGSVFAACPAGQMPNPVTYCDSQTPASINGQTWSWNSGDGFYYVKSCVSSVPPSCTANLKSSSFCANSSAPVSYPSCVPVLSYAGGPINCVSVGGAAPSCGPATYGSPAAACASYNNPGTGTTAKYSGGSCTVTDSHGNITHPTLDPMVTPSNTADPYIPTNTPASGVPTTTPTTTPSSGVPGSGAPAASGVPTTTPTTTPSSGVPGSGAPGGSGGAGGAGAPATPTPPITCTDINTCTTATPGTGTALPALPTSASGSWYVKTYPNGIKGVMSDNFTTLKGTSLFGLIQNIVPSLNGTGSSGCFTLNVWKIGDQLLCIPPMVMTLLGIIMILTALFSARAIIFGG